MSQHINGAAGWVLAPRNPRLATQLTSSRDWGFSRPWVTLSGSDAMPGVLKTLAPPARLLPPRWRSAGSLVVAGCGWIVNSGC